MDYYSASKIPLSILLSFPFFWRPTKICEFVHKTLKILRDRKDGKGIHKLKRKIYKDELKAKYILWPEGSNWKKVLDSCNPRLYDILTTEFRGKERKLKVTDDQLISVCYFLKIIRDKYEHSGDVPMDKRQVLGWYTKNKKGELIVDDNLFLQFWTSKFPRLVPFLWLEFRLLEDELEEYYTFSLNQPYFNDLAVDLDNVLLQLSDAILDNLEQGGLQKRYSSSHESEPGALTLEFRPCNADMIQNILYGKSAVSIEMIQDNVIFSWEVSNRNGKLAKSMTYKRTPPGQLSILNGTSIVITNGCSDVEKSVLLPASASLANSKLIFISSESNGENADAIGGTVASISRNMKCRLEENPLRYEELRESKRRALESETQVYFQNRLVNFEVLLPKNLDTRMSLLSWFSGDALNDLLRRKRLEFLCKRETTSVVEYHQSRLKLSKCSSQQLNWQLDPMCQLNVINYNNGAATAFLGESEEAKTAVIEKCANDIWEQFTNTCVVLIKMSEFMKRVKAWFNMQLDRNLGYTTCCRKGMAQFVTKEIIGCSDKFQENVVKFWLHQKRSFNKLKFDIMIDSLDGVQSSDWQLAGNLLRILNDEFPSVRIWVTARTHLKNEIEAILNGETFIIESYAEEAEQVLSITGPGQKFEIMRRGHVHVTLKEEIVSVDHSKLTKEGENNVRRVILALEGNVNSVENSSTSKEMGNVFECAGVALERGMAALEVKVTCVVERFDMHVRVAREERNVSKYLSVTPQMEKLMCHAIGMLQECKLYGCTINVDSVFTDNN